MKSYQITKVENNQNGWDYINTLRKLFKGTKFHVITRGRNADRKGTIEAAGERYIRSIHRTDIPLKYATHIAVYIRNNEGRHLMEALKMANAKDNVDEVARLKLDVTYLQYKLTSAIDERDWFEKRLNTLKERVSLVKDFLNNPEF